MYRASAFLVNAAKIPISDGKKAGELLQMHEIAVSSRGVFLDGTDISLKIRTQEMSEIASALSAHIQVREQMVLLQKQFAHMHNTVAEGRDMGSVVFPDATLKVYIVADIAIRASRRLKDLGKSSSSMASMIHAMFLRDHRDRNRKESPLRFPPGAVWLDGTSLSINEQVQFILNCYRARCNDE